MNYGDLDKDPTFTTCQLAIEPRLGVSDVNEVAELAHACSTGWFTTHDAVREFEGSLDATLVDAELVGDDQTVVVRRNGATWNVWIWRESAGKSHRVVHEHFVSTAPGRGTMRYATYWTPLESNGVHVWTPVGARFVGWGS